MKKKVNEVRKIFVKLRMNSEELKLLKKNQRQTTERNMSNYIRKVSLQKPVFVKYRNESADDFLRDMVLLKKELNAIGNNFNQAVHKLHLLEKIPEFRIWIIQSRKLQQAVVTKVEEINLRINQLYEKWLLK